MVSRSRARTFFPGPEPPGRLQNDLLSGAIAGLARVKLYGARSPRRGRLAPGPVVLRSPLELGA
jgi:hypothetical protein